MIEAVTGRVNAILHADQAASRRLTPQEARIRNFFVVSFHYSQGDLGVQRHMFMWLQEHAPLGRLPQKSPPYINDIEPPKAHRARTSSVIMRDRDMAWGTLQKIAQGTEEIDTDDLPGTILRELLYREINYQIEGRPHRETDGERYESFFRKYVVQGHTTGSVDLNSLSQELRALMGSIDLPHLSRAKFKWYTQELRRRLYRESYSQDIVKDFLKGEEAGTLLAYLKKIWEKNHPRQKFFPEA